ncbi:YggS family pyridoxal phosphate-dependent enzyme [Alkalibaculum sp. M08DMB]|uniref:Pyridoxal phosphate homeostasis protein n=1 Tax=Alkalibaculum sporogenes TaxID=2655001 RepID=A0A6A7K932_9FIRM|nr:YggS family pyridoxal phosphate-dependent enzyme [Alkalibaculum sporogenes]MPW26019.1 YggS family pyridoxal phosphate-dependent enzyme [Alkalibaculum sporogenes]
MNIEKNLDQIIETIPSDVNLVAVTKNRTVEEIQRVVDYGIIDLGENRVQELIEKFDKVVGDVRWHLIGHLQTNKVKYIIDKVHLIHSVDSLKLAKEISSQSKKNNIFTKILIQINVSREESKYGIYLQDIESFLYAIDELENISVQGLMTMAPNIENIEEIRHIFRKLKELYDKIKDKQNLYKNVDMNFLSMGMTNDYSTALEEGSNIVRIGRGIFV